MSANLHVTPDIEARVSTAYKRHGDYALAAQETNLTVRQVQYIVRDRLGLTSGVGKGGMQSLKKRALTAIVDNGPYTDVMVLHADLPGPHGLHNLVHVLHSLHKQALIDFTEERSGGNGVNYLDITARKLGARVREVVAPPVTPLEEFVPATPEPVAPTYPELDRLVALSAQLSSNETKSAKYLQAAELLIGSDGEVAEMLLVKASEIATTSLSPVESEYLRYAKEHS